MLWPSVRALRKRHPRLLPRLLVLDPTHLQESLLRGEVDVALLDRPPPPSAELFVERLGRLGHGIFAPPGHPLAGRRNLDLREVATYAFAVAAPRADDPVPPDRWPAEIPREELLRVADVAMAADACAEVGVLAVLPDLVGRGHAGGLRRLPVALPSGAEADLYAVARAPAGGAHHARTDAALEVLRARAGTLST